jgi:peptidoglycan/LPS O-acetylase OafA/YrhL
MPDGPVSARTEPASSPATNARSLGYIPGLDGLRALAVTAVLLYHANLPWIPAGFLGVDVFFVISGYLITSLLLTESRKTGKVNFRRFWYRRVRRLLPALFLMIGVVAFYTVVFLPNEASKLRGDLISSIFYVNNWWQIFHHQSYFAAAGRPPMLQHLWSLAVEEQFYLFWPMLFILGMFLFQRKRSRMLIAIGVGIVVSTLLMAILYNPLGDPSRVYYGTDTRASTLLVGVALAFVWSPWRLQAKVGRGARFVLDAIGIGALAGLVWIVLNVNEFQPGLYRGGFLVVAILAAVVIAVAVHPVGGLLNSFLSLPVLIWIGKRSYGIYLWHWPVYMVTRPTLDVPLTGLPLLFIRIAITVTLAELSYRYVEQPIRHGTFMAHFGRLRMSEGAERSRLTRVTLLSGGAVALVLVVIVVGLVNAGPAPLPPGFSAGSATASARAGPGATTTTRAATASATGPDAPSTTVPPAPVNPIIGIGDSVMLGAQSALEARMPGFVTNAAVSRHFGEAVDIARGYRDAGQLGNAVVVHMGTNGLVTADEFDAMMDSFRTVKRVVIVNLKVPRNWEGQDNDVLRDGVARWPNAVLLDWNAAGNANPGWFWDDGFHLQPNGAAAYAGLIADAINRPPAKS